MESRDALRQLVVGELEVEGGRARMAGFGHSGPRAMVAGVWSESGDGIAPAREATSPPVDLAGLLDVLRSYLTRIADYTEEQGRTTLRS